MLNPQEKTTLEIQTSINSRNETRNKNEIQKLETNCNTETKMNLQTETKNEIAIGNEMQKRIGNQRQKMN